jgi:hypothetical protein
MNSLMLISLVRPLNGPLGLLCLSRDLAANRNPFRRIALPGSI